MHTGYSKGFAQNCNAYNTSSIAEQAQYFRVATSAGGVWTCAQTQVVMTSMRDRRVGIAGYGKDVVAASESEFWQRGNIIVYTARTARVPLGLVSPGSVSTSVGFRRQRATGFGLINGNGVKAPTAPATVRNVIINRVLSTGCGIAELPIDIQHQRFYREISVTCRIHQPLVQSNREGNSATIGSPRFV